MSHLYRHDVSIIHYNFIYWDLLLVSGWLLFAVTAPRCFDSPRGPAAAGLLHQWSRRPDTPGLNNPCVPPTGRATNGRRRTWPVLCHSPDTHLVEVAEEQCEREAGCCGCCCGSAALRGSGYPPDSDCGRVLEEAGSCPCQWSGSRREASPGRPLPRCHGHCLGHIYGEREQRSDAGKKLVAAY